MCLKSWESPIGWSWRVMSMGHRTQRVAPSSRGAVDPFFATRIVDGPRRLPETQNREGHPISATSGEPDKWCGPGATEKQGQLQRTEVRMAAARVFKVEFR